MININIDNGPFFGMYIKMRTVKQLCNIRYQRAIIAPVHHPDKWFCMQDEWKCGNVEIRFSCFDHTHD